MENSPEFVYHYTKMSTVLEKILPYNQIRMGPLTNTNDPMEKFKNIIPMIFGSKINDEPKSNSSYINDFKIIKQVESSIEEIRLRNNIFCTSLDDKDIWNPNIILDDGYREYYGWQKASMWAHYGNFNKGVCIKFNFLELSKAIKNSLGLEDREMNKRVSYSNSLILDYSFDLDKFKGKEFDSNLIYENDRETIDFVQSLLFEKHLDWITENEYRWIVYSQEYHPIYVDIPNVIDSIFLGLELDESYHPSFVNLCGSLDINLYTLNWEYNTYSPSVLLERN